MHATAANDCKMSPLPFLVLQTSQLNAEIWVNELNVPYMSRSEILELCIIYSYTVRHGEESLNLWYNYRINQGRIQSVPIWTSTSTMFLFTNKRSVCYQNGRRPKLNLVAGPFISVCVLCRDLFPVRAC